MGHFMGSGKKLKGTFGARCSLEIWQKVFEFMAYNEWSTTTIHSRIDFFFKQNHAEIYIVT